MFSDRAITSVVDDRLGRGEFAAAIARAILSPRSDDGLVLGITGPWGSGKTSLLSLIEAELQGEASVIRFNPWWFAAEDSLVVRFFAELAAQIDDPDVRASVRAYAEILAPLGGVAGAIARVAEIAASEGIEQRRDRVTKQLKRLDQRVVVLIDDIDRLAPTDVADLMRLVNLVGDFENVTYVLAYDAAQTARSLAAAFGIEDPGFGVQYLDKIVQLVYELPHVSAQRLGSLLVEHLDSAMEEAGLAYRYSADESFLGVLEHGVGPLLRTMRDVRRVSNVVPMAIRLVEDNVALCDVAVLESLRIVRPDLHRDLPSLVPLLCTRDEETGRDSPPNERREGAEGAGSDQQPDERLLRDWLGRAGTAAPALEAILAWTFPKAATKLSVEPQEANLTYSRRSRMGPRVSSEAPMLAYLSKAMAGHAVRAATVEGWIRAMRVPEATREIIDPLTKPQVRDLLRRAALEIPSTLDVNEAGRVVCSLLELGAKNPYPRNLADDAARGVIKALATTERERAVCEAISCTRSLTCALVAYRLLRSLDAASDEALQLLVTRVMSTPVPELLAEPEVSALLRLLKDGSSAECAYLNDLVDENDQVFLEVVAWSSAVLEDGPSFNWREACSILGEERLLRRLAETDGPSYLDEARAESRRRRPTTHP